MITNQLNWWPVSERQNGLTGLRWMEHASQIDDGSLREQDESCQVGHEAGAGADLVRAEQLSDLTTRQVLFCCFC